MAIDPARATGRRRRAGTRDNEAGQETRERLLNVAEELFAARGLESVSVRDITDAAGANTAAIHYHFGSKLDLIGAIFDRRAAGLGQRRAEMLAGLEARDDVDLRDVVVAMVRPTAELMTEEAGGRHYVAFLTALGGNADLMHLAIDAYAADTHQSFVMLRRVLPDLPEDVLQLRFAIAKDLVNRVLGQPHGQIHEWVAQLSPGADADIETRLVDLLVGMFDAPVTSPPRRRR